MYRNKLNSIVYLCDYRKAQNILQHSIRHSLSYYRSVLFLLFFKRRCIIQGMRFQHQFLLKFKCLRIFDMLLDVKKSKNLFWKTFHNSLCFCQFHGEQNNDSNHGIYI